MSDTTTSAAAKGYAYRVRLIRRRNYYGSLGQLKEAAGTVHMSKAFTERQAHEYAWDWEAVRDDDGHQIWEAEVVGREGRR